MIRLKVTPVVGLPQFTGWSQVAESTSSASTRLICVFAVSGKHAGNVGRDLSDKISDFYYYDVEQLHEFIESLIEYVESNDCKLFISCALINGGRTVFVTRGGSVFLKRQEKLGQILFSKDEIKIVEGSYSSSDVFVLTTYQASQFLNEIEQKFLQGFDVDIIITSVVPGLHAQNDSSLSAIVFINQPKESEILSSDEKLEEEPSLEASVNFEEEESGEVYKDSVQPQLQMEISNDFSDTKISRLKSIFGLLVGKIIVVFKGILALILTFIKKVFAIIKKIDIKNFLLSIKTLRANGFKGIFNRKMNLDDRPKNKNLLKILMVVIFLLLIISGVIFAYVGKQNEKEKITDLLRPIQENIEVAKSQLNSDPITSRDIIVEVVSSLEKLKEENKDSSSVGLIEDELTKTAEFYNEISGKEELDDLNIFYDLRLVKSDYVANDLDVNENKLVLLDSEKKQVINLDIETKNVNVVDFSEYQKVTDLSTNNTTAFILTDGIKSFDLEDETEIKEIKPLGDSNENATLINAYDRFVYVVNPEKRNIYRYSQEAEGYSDPIGWMRSATGLKYDEITSFSVDGDIWISTADGQVKKFAGGKEETFSIRGLDKEFSNSIKVYTNGDQENIYILEPDNNRIVVISKSGEFQQEIKSVSLATVGSIAVNENLGKIFAVSGSIIFEINLN